ncbi:VOC family protein [Bacillus sp. 31A1R]|uniref:VOC family protein n=1 Tax=Robertmurraya mangrovi TaxID=3098077 RepID=A0ABU5IVU4_9BACI|nr:VOC family protein [Bacillus sp. 31A1R]MDZ5471261.1 VOC family protein [Bacillus sp. 31A1R]
MSNFLFTRVGHNYIPTNNIDQSIEWYTKYLGLKLVSKFMDRGSYLAVLHYPHQNAIATLLIETSELTPLEINRNGVAFPITAINCEDIEYTYEQMQNSGVKIEGELTTLGDEEAKYFYFRDDVGNLLEATWSIWDPKDEVKETFK